MKVGIIVYSKTGNTLSVAKKLEEAFLKAGHSVNLEQIATVNEDPSKTQSIVLKTSPDPGGYDAVVFAAPVWAFSMCSVMRLYLSQLSTLEGKKVGLFVTQSFSKAWLGGNHAIRQMEQACKSRKATIWKTGVINWSNKKREEQIAALLEAFTQL